MAGNFKNLLYTGLTGAVGLAIGVPSMLEKKFKVECARYQYATNGKLKFELKHLLDAFDASNPTEPGVAAQWNRQKWNDMIRDEYFLGIFGYGPIQSYGRANNTTMGSEQRLSIIMQTGIVFMRAYDMVIDGYKFQQLKTGLTPQSRTLDLAWHHERVDVMHAVYNTIKLDYDIYIMEDAFVVCGFQDFPYHRYSKKAPAHFERIVMSRPNETEVVHLKQQGRDVMQARFDWAETFQSFFMRNSTCIGHPP